MLQEQIDKWSDIQTVVTGNINRLTEEKSRLESGLNDVNQQIINLRKESENNEKVIENMDDMIDTIFKIHDEALTGKLYLEINTKYFFTVQTRPVKFFQCYANFTKSYDELFTPQTEPEVQDKIEKGFSYYR